MNVVRMALPTTTVTNASGPFFRHTAHVSHEFRSVLFMILLLKSSIPPIHR